MKNMNKNLFYYSRTKPWLLGNFTWMKSSEKSTGQTLPTYRPRSTSVVTLDTSHPLLHLVAELSSRTVNPSPKKSEFRGKRPSVCKYNVLVFCHRKSFQSFFFLNVFPCWFLFAVTAKNIIKYEHKSMDFSAFSCFISTVKYKIVKKKMLWIGFMVINQNRGNKMKLLKEQN